MSAQYQRLRDRLERMSKSEHFITYRGDKAVIGEAADTIARLVARVDRLKSELELYHRQYSSRFDTAFDLLLDSRWLDQEAKANFYLYLDGEISLKEAERRLL